MLPAEYDSHTLELPGGWNSLYTKMRSTKSRQRLRSKYNALRKRGKLVFKQVKELEDKVDATQKILEWKSAQLDQRGSRNPFGTPNNPSLIYNTIQTSVRDENGHGLKVFGLYQDSVLIAGMLAFVDAQSFYYFVSAYSDEVPGKYSIGSQLLIKTMQFACRANLKRYDFLIGDEPYKFDWCDGKIPLIHYSKPFTRKGRIFCLGLRGQLELKKYVSRNSAVADVVRHLIKTNRQIELENERSMGKPAASKTVTGNLGYPAFYSNVISSERKRGQK